MGEHRGATLGRRRDEQHGGVRVKYLRIVNWDKWQTYRTDRGAPPWIKVHRLLLRNPEWLQLSDAERGHLVSLWILAADKEGLIPADANALKKILGLDNAPNLERLMSLGFIEHDATVTPAWRQDDANVTPHIISGQVIPGQVSSEERETRARDPIRGRVINNPATASDLDLIAPTQKQMIMLIDKANAAGTTVQAAAEELGIPVAGINVSRIRAHLEFQATAPRASPKTFGQLRDERTNQATANVLRRLSGCSDNSSSPSEKLLSCEDSN